MAKNAPLLLGSIVWAYIADANGVRKWRPAVVVTPSEHIRPDQPLDLVKPDSLSPVDAAALPNGTVLLLERHWSPFPGLALRISRIPGEALAPGSYLAPERLALLAPPLNVDNMEGLAVRQDGAGRVFLYLLSDDNFNALQRTLLLLFELDQAEAGLPRKP